jgi:hypothetical protein
VSKSRAPRGKALVAAEPGEARGGAQFPELVLLLLEWITLHDNPNFRGFVDFLRTELDSVGPADADICRDLFSRAVEVEFSFFEAAYMT